jgi:hypothetical protein
MLYRMRNTRPESDSSLTNDSQHTIRNAHILDPAATRRIAPVIVG